VRTALTVEHGMALLKARIESDDDPHADADQ
jgi:hypothetical protein